MSCGAYRCVIFIGPYAVKFPRARNLRNFREGLQCNRWEREMWRVWQPILQWETLCPIVFADPLGLIVVMPRAERTVTYVDFALLPDYHPETSAEFKTADWGRVDDRVVALDYGLPDDEMVAEYRKRYMTRNSAATVVKESRTELLPSAVALHGWAASKPFVRRLWIYGSQARGEAQPHDLDVAVEIDPVGNDDNAFTSFVHDVGAWRAELQPLLNYKLDLKWYDKSRPVVWHAVKTDGIKIYEREDAA